MITRLKETRIIDHPDVVLLSGTFVLHDTIIRNLLDLRVFIDVDSDTRLSNLVIRKSTNTKTLELILNVYLKQVKVCYEEYVYPSKKYADVVIPRGNRNSVAIDLLTRHIQDILQ